MNDESPHPSIDPRIAAIAELHKTDYVNSGDDQERYEAVQAILRSAR